MVRGHSTEELSMKIDSVRDLIIALPEIFMFIFPFMVIFLILIWLTILHIDYFTMRKELKEKRIGYLRFIYLWIVVFYRK